MPEFATVQAGVSRTVGAVAATTTGTQIISDAAANTKGTWVELTAATEFDASWVMVTIGVPTGGSDYLVDVGIGAATEQVIIPDMYARPRNNDGGGYVYLFPMFVPAGSRLTARCQDSFGAGDVLIVLTLFSGTLLYGGSRQSMVSAYGSVTASLGTNIDPGGTANTDSAWTELTAATDRDHYWLVLAGRYGDASISATRWLVDIGIGAATEQEIISDLLFMADITSDMPLNVVMCFPYFVPKGSRLTARARSSSIVDGDRDVWLKLYGC